jgi:hypothetical protein
LHNAKYEILKQTEIIISNADFTEWVKPEDLANVVVLLSSDETKTITGAAVPTFGIS